VARGWRGPSSPCGEPEEQRKATYKAWKLLKQNKFYHPERTGQRCGRAVQPIEVPVPTARTGGGRWGGAQCRRGQRRRQDGGVAQCGSRVVLPLVVSVLRRDQPHPRGGADTGVPSVGRRLLRPQKCSCWPPWLGVVRLHPRGRAVNAGVVPVLISSPSPSNDNDVTVDTVVLLAQSS
jgi:hypothetical protein